MQIKCRTCNAHLQQQQVELFHVYQSGRKLYAEITAFPIQVIPSYYYYLKTATINARFFPPTGSVYAII